MTDVMFAMLNTPEIIMILVLALILFGAKKLPELAKGLGHGIKEFKKATRDVTDELQSAIDTDSPPPSRRPPLPRKEMDNSRSEERHDDKSDSADQEIRAGSEKAVPQTSSKS